MFFRRKQQNSEEHIKKGVCHVVSVDMGYGHERPASALIDLAYNHEVHVANNYRGIPKEDKQMWKQGRELYETISRLKPVPIIGHYIFEAMDRMQQIEPFYPRRDLSEPTFQLKQQYRFLEKGLGKHLIKKLAEHPLPLICTFPLPAFAAELNDYPNDIYLVATDTDISRAWVPLDGLRSRIKYFAPTGRVVERLQLYGIRRENIYLTGFPFAKSLIGGIDSSVIKKDLGQRLCNLDPHGHFYKKYYKTLELYFGVDFCKRKKPRPFTVAFAIGGAGAQKTLGIDIAKSLSRKIALGKVRLLLVAGARRDVASYFKTEIKKLGMEHQLGKNLEIVYMPTRSEYFQGFNDMLHSVDILWTKPSELSFFTGLGIPIIIAPSVGSQEEYNRLWLQQVGGGVAQHEAQYTDEWLFDWLHAGAFARMAWNGFTDAPKHGIYRIEDIMLGRQSDLPEHPLIV